MDYTYKRSRYGFKKNIIKSEEAPIRLASQQIWDNVRQLSNITEVEKFVRLSGYGVEHNWTKQSIF